MLGLLLLLCCLQTAHSFLLAPLCTPLGTLKPFLLAKHECLQLQSSTRLFANGGDNEDTLEEANRMKEEAAKLREQALALEEEVVNIRKSAALKSFAEFDSNKDGLVDLEELKAGMEKELRKKETSRRKTVGIAPPTPEELAAIGISDETARQLLAIYDDNADGVLQLEEFRKTSIITQSLELLIAQQREELRLAKLSESEAKMAAKQMEGLLPVLNDEPPNVADRLLSALPYILPLMDSLFYGGHLLNSNPALLELATPVLYLSALYRSLPFSGLILFITFQTIAGNPGINKLVRFNLRQAINMDIALFLPSLVASLALAIPGLDQEALGPVAAMGGDIIAVTIWTSIAYSIVSSALGVIPNKLPVFGKMNRENPDRDDKYAGVVPRMWRDEKMKEEKRKDQEELEKRQERTRQLMEEGEGEKKNEDDDSKGEGGSGGGGGGKA